MKAQDDKEKLSKYLIILSFKKIRISLNLFLIPHLLTNGKPLMASLALDKINPLALNNQCVLNSNLVIAIIASGLSSNHTID